MHDTHMSATSSTPSHVDAPPGGDHVTDILAGVERQFEQLRAIQAEHALEVEALARRSEELDAREATVEEAMRERESAIDGIEADLAARRQQIQEEHDTIDERRNTLEGERAEVERRRVALRAKWDELEQRERAAADAETQVGPLRQQVEKLESELRVAREGAQMMHEQCEESNRKLEAAGEKILQFSNLLQQRPEAAAPPDDGERDARIAELEFALAAAEDQVRKTDESAQRQADDLRGRVLDLERRLEEAKTEAETRSGSDPAAGAEARAIKGEARRLSEMSEELKHREAGLQRMKKKMEDDRRRAKEAGDRAPILEEEVRELRIQQRRIEEHRKMLTEAERQMIRRWARPRAMVLVCWLLVILGVTAIGSWTAAGHFFPPRVAATVTVAASTRDATDDQLAMWQHWHEGLLYDTDFHADIAERMGDRLLEPMRSPSAVSKMVFDDLAVDAAHPGELTLSLARPNMDEAILLLDVLATSVADTARLRQEQREDGLATSIRGETGVTSAGRPTFAQASPVPIADERLLYGGGMFGASLLVSLMIAGALSTWLARARPTLRDEQLSALEASYCEAAGQTDGLKPLAI